MSSTITVRSWTSADRDLARRLHADRGWGPRSIWRALVQSGVRVAESTVREWVDPAACARRREAGRIAARRKEAARRRASNGPWLRRDATVEYRMVRIEALVRAGVPDDLIGRLLGLDFGTPLTEREVDAVLTTGEPPEHWRQPSEIERGRASA